MTNYLIMSTSELPLVHFDDVLETSTNTLRYSLDGTKTIIKWQDDTPNFVQKLTNIEGPYMIEEILPILAGTDWTEADI